MNKFAKLLSALCLVGALSCGVAVAAGCGENKDGEEEAKGTLHSAVAATCTESGIKQNYYEYDGKYYSDAACTKEISLASITSAPTGHTYVYTDKKDGLNHGVTCSVCDLAETTEAHSDDNSDGKCDECGATVYVGIYTAKAATCTKGGLAGHYETAELPGKYFSDRLCTKEVTAESLATPVIDHTYAYTNKGDGLNHGVTCSVCDLAETTEAHSDDNSDGKCDECGATVRVGAYTEKAATCTESGLAGHYETADLPGKYFSDKLCTKEVTAESLEIPATGHTYVYGDNGDNTHSISCSKGDLTADNSAHIDKNSDGVCDLCGGTVTSGVAGTLHEAKAATCTEAGNSKYYTYDGEGYTGKYYSDINCEKEITWADINIPAIAHANKKHVEAKDTSCAAAGNKEYWYCPDCKNYYSDEACTEATTLESVTIPATEHTYVYTNQQNGTHSITCENCDLAETTEAHSDGNSDGKCDKCGIDMTAFINSLVAGTYVSVDGSATHELVITVTGSDVTVSLDGKTGELYAKTDDSAAFDYDGVQCTLTKSSDSNYSYVLTYTSKRASIATTLNLFEKPDEYIDLLSDVQGVYTGEVIFIDSANQYCKATRIVIYSDGALVYTYIPVANKSGAAKEGAEQVTNIVSASDRISINYNIFNIGRFTFRVLESDVTGTDSYTVKSIHVLDDGGADVEAVFTLTAEALPTIPSDSMLGTVTYDCFASSDGEYLVYNNGVAFLFNYIQAYVVSGDESNGYLIYLDTVTNGGVNYLLKPTFESGKVTGFTVYKADGTTLLGTLTNATTQEATELKSSAEGAANMGATVFIRNDSYALYKVVTSGVYTFSTAYTDDTFGIYTSIGFKQGLVTDAVVLSSSDSKQIKLYAGSFIAVDVANKDVSFTAKYVGEDFTIEYANFKSDGTYTISSIVKKTSYYVKGTAATAGEYVVSVTYGNDISGKGVRFTIGETQYGYKYANWAWSLCSGGETYSATLAAGDEVKIEVYSDSLGSNTLGDVVIHFETKEAYEARINGTSSTDMFTTSQQGTYTATANDGSGDWDITIVVSANGINYTGTCKYDNSWSVSATDCTYISTNDNGVQYWGIDNYDLKFTMTNSGIVVSDDGASLCTYTATKSDSSSGGSSSGTTTTTFAGFASELCGTYTATTTLYGDTYTITIIISASGVNYAVVCSNTVYSVTEQDLTWVSTNSDGSYTWSGIDCNLYKAEIKFTISTSGIVVTMADEYDSNDMLSCCTYTATKNS